MRLVKLKKTKACSLLTSYLLNIVYVSIILENKVLSYNIINIYQHSCITENIFRHEICFLCTSNGQLSNHEHRPVLTLLKELPIAVKQKGKVLQSCNTNELFLFGYVYLKPCSLFNTYFFRSKLSQADIYLFSGNENSRCFTYKLSQCIQFYMIFYRKQDILSGY